MVLVLFARTAAADPLRIDHFGPASDSGSMALITPANSLGPIGFTATPLGPIPVEIVSLSLTGATLVLTPPRPTTPSSWTAPPMA